MIFLVDFIARGLGQGLAAGARYWVVSASWRRAPDPRRCLADRVGFRARCVWRSWRRLWQSRLVVLTDRPLALIASSAIVRPRSWRGAARAQPDPGTGRGRPRPQGGGACARPPSPWARRLQPMSSPACSNGRWRVFAVVCGRGRGVAAGARDRSGLAADAAVPNREVMNEALQQSAIALRTQGSDRRARKSLMKRITLFRSTRGPIQRASGGHAHR